MKRVRAVAVTEIEQGSFTCGKGRNDSKQR